MPTRECYTVMLTDAHYDKTIRGLLLRSHVMPPSHASQIADSMERMVPARRRRGACRSAKILHTLNAAKPP